MIRTDIHKPSSIDVNDYQFVALGHAKIQTLGDCYLAEQNREILWQHMARTGGNYSQHDHGGTCMVCGNVMCIYTVIFYHEKTNTYLRIGFTCAEKLEFGCSHVFLTFKRACADAKKNYAGKCKAEQILKENDLVVAWDVYTNPTEPKYNEYGLRCQISTIKDIVSKLVRFGSISEAQMSFLKSLQEKVTNWEQIKAERAKEALNAEDVPTGRVEITGVIVKTDTKVNDFGERFVMTIKDDRGFMVWGTQTRDLSDGIRGTRVKFTATCEPSDKDSKFGFFKRPAKATIINDIRAHD